jgi:hypothetical protein
MEYKVTFLALDCKVILKVNITTSLFKKLVGFDFSFKESLKALLLILNGEASPFRFYLLSDDRIRPWSTHYNVLK